MAGDSADRPAPEHGADQPPRTPTAEALTALPPGWTVLHGLHQPDRRRRVIDHLVIGPGGVFVVIEPPWTGLVDVRGGVLRHNGRRRDRMVRAAAAAGAAVARLLPGVGTKLVRPVLCVDSTPPLSGVSGGVVLCSPDNVVELLTTRSAVLADGTARQASTQLLRALVPVGAARQLQPRRASRIGRWVRATRDVAVVVGALALVALFVLRFDTVRRYVDQTLSSDSKELGSPVTVDEADEGVRVTVTARRVSDVRARTAQGQGRHVRLLGVQLALHNRATTVLRLDPQEAVVLRPVLGKSYPVEPASTPIREGRLLDSPLRLGAGSTTQGWVVFQVPADAAFDQVSVRFGESAGSVARWDVSMDRPGDARSAALVRRATSLQR
jgi:hypothetical protein